jgi:hypothetical protein
VGTVAGFRRGFLAQIERETVSISKVAERVLQNGDVYRILGSCVERGGRKPSPTALGSC